MLMFLFWRISDSQVRSRRKGSLTGSDSQELVRDGISTGNSHPSSSKIIRSFDMHSSIICSFHLFVQPSLEEKYLWITSAKIRWGTMRNVFGHRNRVMELLVVLHKTRVTDMLALFDLFDCLQDVWDIFGLRGIMNCSGN
jgi:hypothetical protein